jgi:hypothetical protein
MSPNVSAGSTNLFTTEQHAATVDAAFSALDSWEPV